MLIPFKKNTYAAAYCLNEYGSANSKSFLSYSPINNAELGRVPVASSEDYEQVISDLQASFLKWRSVPSPVRAGVIRKIGDEIRKHKDPLGELVTLETGKILEEGKGEIQEIIDIIDFAVGLARQGLGQVMHSERPEHRMIEQWHPLGIISVITAFNFPAAVWGWNAALAVTLGNVILWKPSEFTPLTAIALHELAANVAAKEGFPGIFALILDDSPELGKKMSADRRIPLVSATGSCNMGRSVAQAVGARLGKCLLELGGNNSVILMEDANLELAIPSTIFGAVGTAGQRCTSTRRLLVHKSISKKVIDKFSSAYAQLKIGNPLKAGIHIGPLIHQNAVNQYLTAIESAIAQGADLIYGGKLVNNQESPFYVEPTLIQAKGNLEIIKHETFAPILYIQEFETLEEAIELNNSVPQGLSSAIFTQNIKYSEKFISTLGSDCGIANVNLGTSGAEIGGAFGGEKDTGGGRESGSDAWKNYVRRMTSTINYGDQLPLAQGVKFDLGT